MNQCILMPILTQRLFRVLIPISGFPTGNVVSFDAPVRVLCFDAPRRSVSTDAEELNPDFDTRRR